MVEPEGGDSPAPTDRVFPQDLADWLAVNAPQEMAQVARSLHKEMLPLLAAGLSPGEQPVRGKLGGSWVCLCVCLCVCVTVCG